MMPYTWTTESTVSTDLEEGELTRQRAGLAHFDFLFPPSKQRRAEAVILPCLCHGTASDGQFAWSGLTPLPEVRAGRFTILEIPGRQDSSCGRKRLCVMTPRWSTRCRSHDGMDGPEFFRWGVAEGVSALKVQGVRAGKFLIPNQTPTAASIVSHSEPEPERARSRQSAEMGKVPGASGEHGDSRRFDQLRANLVMLAAVALTCRFSFFNWGRPVSFPFAD